MVLRWTGAIVTAVLALFLLNKGMDLSAMGTEIDSTGIEVKLLGIVWSEQVLAEDIPKMARGFMITSIIFFLFSVTLLLDILVRQPIKDSSETMKKRARRDAAE